MSFQAPFSITDYARLRMTADQYNADREQAMVEGIGKGIQSLMATYVEGQAMNAKGEAYGDFMSKHGQQLGFDPNWLSDFSKKKPWEQAMIGDSIIGMQNAGNRLMGINAMNHQASLYGGGRTGGRGMGGAGSGDYVVGSGWGG